MGKSPGKWIKAKLFGKKSAKSVVSKKGEAAKEAFIISKASSGVVASSEPVISNAVPVVTESNGHNLASKNQTVAKPPEEISALVSGSQDGGVTSAGLTSIDNSDTMNQEQAAAKVQAVVRGFLARRAFWALKGIIRLQALIRGHLVRRQAVATLHCMRRIVKLQALVRGQKVRLSEAGIEVKGKCNLEKLQRITVGILQSNRPVKLSNNPYAQKLLASSPNAMPLSLHYDSDDANSAWNWLERWSISHFWELVVEVKRDKVSKSSTKSGANKEVELENGKSKRGHRRNSSAHHDNSPDYGKPRVTTKKSISHHGEPAHENGPNELEKVKRNLRKVSLTKSDSKDKPEAVFEKPNIKVSKTRESVNSTTPEQLPNSAVEKHYSPTDSFLNEKHSDPSDKIPAENGSSTFGTEIREHDAAITQPAMEVVVAAVDEPSAETLNPSIQKDENPPVVNEIFPNEDSNGKNTQKAKRRRSLSTKPEYPENITQNTPALPSYMQATESAKAKLKAQGSPRLTQDATATVNGVVRRHSLPSSTGAKLNTPSPRIQKLVQSSSNGKGGGIKIDKSLSASKDYNSNSKF